MSEQPDALKLLDFWISAGPEKWFNGGEAFDDACRAYEALWEAGRDGELDHWAETASGMLALLILLDQIPRNIFRGDAKQFSTDAKALGLAGLALDAGFDHSQMMPVKNFYYLPFMHSENLEDQLKCCDLLRPLDSMQHYYFALLHMDAIARFGRFPHRNAVLGRETTDAERAYLETGGFGASH